MRVLTAPLEELGEFMEVKARLCISDRLHRVSKASYDIWTWQWV